MSLNEICNKMWTWKHLSVTFCVSNYLKSGEVISALFSNFALERFMRDIKANPEGLKLHGPRYLWSEKREMNYLLRWRVVGVAHRRPGFDPRSVHVWLVVNVGVLEQICFKYFGIIQLSLHTYISIHVPSTLNNSRDEQIL